MKKSARNRIIVWSIVSCLLVAILVFGIMNIQSIGSLAVTPIKLNNVKNLDDYVSGEAEFDKTKVSSLDVNWAAGKVNVRYSDTDKIVISEDANVENVEDRMCWYLNDKGTLSIYSEKKSQVFFGISFGFKDNYSKTLNIEIPENMSFEELHISAASADVFADNAIAEEVNVETASGNIDIGNIKADSVDISNVSGKVDAHCNQVGEMSVSTVSGETFIVGNFRELQTESVSGSTEVSVDNGVEKIDSDSISGGIKVTLADDITGFTAKHESVSGSFNCEFNGMNKDDEFIYGDGTVEISMETVSGNMTVKE